MSEQRFLSGSREQAFLLLPDMREWLPPDHLVWVIYEAVDRLDFSLFEAEYRDDGQGRTAYDPRLMATLLLYGYGRRALEPGDRAPLLRGRRLPGRVLRCAARPRDDRALPAVVTPRR